MKHKTIWRLLCLSLMAGLLFGNINTDAVFAAQLPQGNEDLLLEDTVTPTAIPASAEVPDASVTPETTATPAIELQNTPTPAAEPTTTPVPTQDVKEAEPTAKPVPGESKISLGSVLTQSAVNDAETANPLNATVPLLLYDLTNGKVLASNQAFDKITPNRISDMMALLVIIQNLDKNLEVTIDEGTVTAAAALSSPSLTGFAAGDKITMKNLALCYMMTRSDDSRLALINAMGITESEFVSLMNETAKNIGMKKSKYVSSASDYNAGQFTTVYDTCVLFRELLKYSLYADNCQSSSLSVSYTKSDGTKTSIKCKNKDAGYSQIYGGNHVPEGYTQIAEVSGGIQSTGLAQFVIVKSPDGTLYFSGLGAIPFEKDVSVETGRLLLVIHGEVYYDKDQTLPLGDDSVRYNYLFGTDVVYYTTDNKAPGYATSSLASQYMMTINVPVWQIDSNGNKFATSYSITINRKLVSSVKTIFNEIFALEIQFPIKYMYGYSYRQSGGVGLSNSTLMSMHSYGAAIDINPGDYDNDYYLGAGNDLRDTSNPYCVPQEVIDVFEANGWFWGGNFNICVDSMHFQYLGLDYLTYQGNDPFDVLTTDSSTPMKGYKIENLQARLKELGFSVNTDGVYSSRTKQAVMKFQTKNGLEVTGVVNYKTWETLINLTHYMDYVF